VNTYRKLVNDRLVSIDILNLVVQTLPEKYTELDFAQATQKAKKGWAAAKHEIDLQYPGEDYRINAYVVDSKGVFLWAYDGEFEALGISSRHTIDKQLEGKRLWGELNDNHK
jgi:hypothetical protein